MKLLLACALLGALLACGVAYRQDPTAAANGATISLTKREGSCVCNLEVVGETVFPLSAQQPIKVSPDSVLKVMGFAVDQERGQPAGGVDVVVDSSAYAAQYGLPRGDVGHALKNDAYQAVGFTFAMPARTFQPGTHKVYIRIISADKQTYKDGPGVLISIK